jgi:hypothetical protein
MKDSSVFFHWARFYRFAVLLAVSVLLVFFDRPDVRASSKRELSPASRFYSPNLEFLKRELRTRGAVRLARLIDPFMRYFREIPPRAMIEKIRPIAEAVRSGYRIEEVYGLGYPFYVRGDREGASAIERRCAETLRRFLDANPSISRDAEDDMIRRLLPDFDLLVIFDPVYSASLNGNLENVMNNDFNRHVWRFFLEGFVRDIQGRNREAERKIRVHLGDVERDSLFPLVEPFTETEPEWESLLIHLDLMTVSRPVWEATPLLVTDRDIEMFYYLRDVLFTASEIVSPASEIVAAFRMNFLLQTLRIAESSVSDRPGLFDRILSRHPYEVLIREVPEIMHSAIVLWEEVLDGTIAQGFVKENPDGSIVLTPGGARYLDTVLEERDRVFREGIDAEIRPGLWHTASLVESAA